MGQKIDQGRLKLAMETIQKDKGEKIKQEQKQVINLNLFRQEVLRQMQQFHHENHEFLKMCSVMVQSSFDQKKFTKMGIEEEKDLSNQKGNKNKNEDQMLPLVRLSMQSQFNCTYLAEKVSIKDVYNKVPYSKQSILIEKHQNLNPDYLFFLFQHKRQSTAQLRKRLQNLSDQRNSSESRGQLINLIKEVAFFDILYFLYPKCVVHEPTDKENEISVLSEMSLATYAFFSKMEQELDEESQDQILECILPDTYERIIEFQNNPLCLLETLSFNSIYDYMKYKKNRSNVFKTEGVYTQYIEIATNIRNIISSQKIYLVEIIEEIHLSIRLSNQSTQLSIMGEIHRSLIDKANQYLRLLCGYTQSTILFRYNIENYPQKIYSFLQQSIRMGKPYQRLPEAVLNYFEVLSIWYELPPTLFGYKRQDLHQNMYTLLKAIINFQDKLKEHNLYEQLKIRKANIKYD